MLVKTSDLTGPALDWAVTTAQGVQLVRSHRGGYYTFNENYSPQYSYLHAAEACAYDEGHISPSTDWAQGGPIIERESIYLIPNENADGWFAHKVGSEQGDYNGDTPLIAAMRCYVASKLGDTVEIPDDLM